MEENFIKYIEQSIKDHWDLPALTDFKGATSSYKDVARKIEKLHLLFEHCVSVKGIRSLFAAGIPAVGVSLFWPHFLTEL